MRSFFYGRPEHGHSQYSQKWLERNETRLPTGIINGSFAVESQVSNANLNMYADDDQLYTVGSNANTIEGSPWVGSR